MQGRITAQAFSFDQQFKPYQKDEFLMVVLNPLYFKLNFHHLPPLPRHEIKATGKLRKSEQCSSVECYWPAQCLLEKRWFKCDAQASDFVS